MYVSSDSSVCMHTKYYSQKKALLVLKVILDSNLVLLLQTHTVTHLNLSEVSMGKGEK